jgi:hypothetical protein
LTGGVIKVSQGVLPLINGQLQEIFNQSIGSTFDVMELNSNLLEKQALLHNMLPVKFLKSVVFVVCIDMQIRATIQHSMEGMKVLDDGEQLFVANHVVAL